MFILNRLVSGIGTLRGPSLAGPSQALTCAIALLGMVVGTPGWAQPAKRSQADLIEELVGTGRPLTVRRAPAEHKIADRYIVLFTSGVADPHQEARDIVAASGGTLHLTYGHAVKGFAATLSPQTVERLRSDPRIALIEEDRRAHATSLPLPPSPQVPAPSWGLDRIDQRGPILDGSYGFPVSAGSGVHIYIIDTGILGGIFGAAGAHVELDGRIGDGIDVITPSTNGNDCVGHGTFVAALAAGTTVGVAKLATVHPVRVLDCGEGGSASTIIAGINWVTSDHLAHPGQKSVANLSLTVNGIDTAVDQAVQSSINAGIVYTIAAGNSGGQIDLVTGADLGDSCNLSPQRVGAALTVGAMDDATAFDPPGVFDRITTFSDIGGCVDLYAPGVHMTSASIASTVAMTGPPFDNRNHLGTSYSAPLVAGVAATYFAANPSANASQVMSAITANATLNALTFVDVPSGPNRLLYSDFQTDIQTTVSSNNGAPAVGAQFSYTFQVKNNGPFNSMDSVHFSDPLPSSVGPVNTVVSRGSCAGTTAISCDLGPLAVGEQAIIVVTVTAPSTPLSFTNTGTAGLQPGQTDRAPANDSATLTLVSH
jgi:uncharacterized repeat protein (TIGR01451 family)